MFTTYMQADKKKELMDGTREGRKNKRGGDRERDRDRQKNVNVAYGSTQHHLIDLIETAKTAEPEGQKHWNCHRFHLSKC